MAKPPRKTLMRSLGEFFGHIAQGVKADPAATSGENSHSPSHPDSPGRQVVRRTVEEEKRGNMVLRRTTIEEIEVRNDPNHDQAHD